jgi:hypothetical protein
MARDPVAPSKVGERAFLRPWPILLGGLLLTVLGLVLASTELTALRVILLGAGVLAAGVAVLRRLRGAGWELNERVESAGVLALAAFVALLAYLGMDRGDVRPADALMPRPDGSKPDYGWDSGQMFFGALAGVALAGSVLVLLPSLARRVVISLLLIFHFGGMCTAVTSVDPPNGTAPWLSMQLWAYVYRPYLSFMYLSNAYHFYSPDPGPPTLLWFRVQYEDGTFRWIKVPDRDQSPIGLHYQRMLALTESTNNPVLRLPLTEAEKWQLRQQGRVIDHDSWEEILQRRRLGTTMRGHPYPIQLVANMELNMQYREPQDLAKKLIASYARHVAANAPHTEDPSIKVKSVKVYRLTHTILSPAELAQGGSPDEEARFMPFFEGEFDPDGHLVDPRDPFLYWYLPIVWVPGSYPAEGTGIYVGVPIPPGAKLLNCLKIHAGDITSASAAEHTEP